MKPSHWIVIASISGALAVALGAYHAHGLAKRLTASGIVGEQLTKRLDNCETAVRYQAVHSLAMLAAAAISMHAANNRFFARAQSMFLAGMTLFSGGLYLFVFTGNFGHWSIVPLGGLCLIVAWVLLAIAGATISSQTAHDR